jgi:hypothetical protein
MDIRQNQMRLRAVYSSHSKFHADLNRPGHELQSPAESTLTTLPASEGTSCVVPRNLAQAACVCEQVGGWVGW